jgi:hypothetical protein
MAVVVLYQKGINRKSIGAGVWTKKFQNSWNYQEMALTPVIGLRRFPADNFVLSSRDKTQNYSAHQQLSIDSGNIWLKVHSFL